MGLMTRTVSRSRPILLAAALLAAAFGPRLAEAQIDTPAASEARAALRDVVAHYGDRAQWDSWSQLLNVPDLRYELRAGEQGEPEVMRLAILELLAGRIPQFSEPAFQRLAKALDVRSQELTWLPAAEWPSACEQAADNYQPVTREAIEAARVIFEQRLDALEQRLPSVRLPESRWAQFLFWAESRAQASPRPGQPPTDAATLNRLETRWTAAPTVWDADQLYDASLAATTYFRLVRSYLVGETQAQHAAAWRELGQLLAALGPQRSDTSNIAAAVALREQLRGSLAADRFDPT